MSGTHALDRPAACRLGADAAFQAGPDYLDLGPRAVVPFVSIAIWRRRLNAHGRPTAQG